MKYVVDSIGTNYATFSGPHGISLSTTIDNNVFMDGTPREADEKTPDSKEEVSERSVLKVSPAAVRQEVSQAIINKKGMLIILKEAEDKEEGKDMSALSALSDPMFPEDTEHEETETTPKEKETLKEDNTVGLASVTTEIKKQSSREMEIKSGDMPLIKSIDSPNKAMASWISKEVKTEVPEVISRTTKEVQELTFGPLQQTAEMFPFEVEQSKSSLTQITVSEPSAASVAVVLYKY